MEGASPHQVTMILNAAAGGDQDSSARLLPILYSELRRLARSLMANTPSGNTLQATALVHEAYLRLVPDKELSWNSRGHFFGAAAQAMRRILVEQARRKKSGKHGGDQDRIDIDVDSLGLASSPGDFLDLDRALDELGQLDERIVNVVLMRFLTGLTIEETAVALGVSATTVQGDWRFARAFLYKRLHDSAS